MERTEGPLYFERLGIQSCPSPLYTTCYFMLSGWMKRRDPSPTIQAFVSDPQVHLALSSGSAVASLKPEAIKAIYHQCTMLNDSIFVTSKHLALTQSEVSVSKRTCDNLPSVSWSAGPWGNNRPSRVSIDSCPTAAVILMKNGIERMDFCEVVPLFSPAASRLEADSVMLRFFLQMTTILHLLLKISSPRHDLTPLFCPLKWTSPTTGAIHQCRCRCTWPTPSGHDGQCRWHCRPWPHNCFFILGTEQSLTRRALGMYFDWDNKRFHEMTGEEFTSYFNVNTLVSTYALG